MEKLIKRPIGKEDIAFDLSGIDAYDNYQLPDGSSLLVKKINSRDIPVTQKTRNLFSGSSNVDQALQKIKNQVDSFTSQDAMIQNTEVIITASDDINAIKNKINEQKRNLGGFTLTFTFPAALDQKLAESIIFRNFFNGKIVIQGEKSNDLSPFYDLADIYAIFQFDNCFCSVTVKNFAFVHQFSSYAIAAKSTASLVVDNCTFSGSGSSYAVLFDVSNGKLNNCKYYSDNDAKIVGAPQRAADKLHNELQDELQEYLPLVGGTMTGDLVFNPSNGNYQMYIKTSAGRLAIFGANQAAVGGVLRLIGIDDTGNYSCAGGWRLTAADGTNIKGTMEGRSDGKVYINSKEAVAVIWWHNGSSWYRKYADGFIEQGGAVDKQATTVTLHTPFSTTGYIVNLAVEGSNARGYAVGYHTKTTTAFAVEAAYATNEGVSNEAGTTASRISWYACGY